MKGRKIPYTAAELEWLEANRTMVIGDYHAAFVKAFNRPDVSAMNLHSLRKRKGWRTGRTGQFVQGECRADNPARKGHTHAGCEKGWFRKGNAPHNRVPLGTERIGKDGYVEVKVALPNPYVKGQQTRFIHKHRYLWEQKNGPLPKDHALKCKDGNKQNCDPANWELIPRGMLPRLNGKGSRGRQYDKAPAEVKPAIMAIARLEHTVATRLEETKP